MFIAKSLLKKIKEKGERFSLEQYLHFILLSTMNSNSKHLCVISTSILSCSAHLLS